MSQQSHNWPPPDPWPAGFENYVYRFWHTGGDAWWPEQGAIHVDASQTQAVIRNTLAHELGHFYGLQERYVDTVFPSQCKGEGILLGAFWGPYYQGLMDQVRIYDRALTGTDIQALFNQGG